MTTYKYLIALLLGLFPLGVVGQPKSVSLDTFTVSALRVEVPQYATGRHIVVLTAEEIQNLPVNTIDELLRYVPGLEAQSRGAFGVQSDFSIQGSTFSQVLVLIDGMRINDPLTGHFNSNLPINPRDIHRIEVLKGPAAAIYGADAMGGVINIITKIHAPLPVGLQADLQGMTGAYGLLSTTNYLQYSTNKLRLTGGYMRHQADGHPLDEGDSAWFNINTVSLAARYQISNQLAVSWRGGYDFRDFNAKYFYTRSSFDESVETITGWWQQVQLKHQGSRHQMTADVAYKWNEDIFLFNPAFGEPNQHVTQLLNGQLNYQLRLTNKLQWAAGLQTTNRDIVSNDRGDHNEWQIGLYSGFYYQLLDNLQLNGSVRLDQDENYGTEFTPQLSAAYWWSTGVIRAAAGRSIRAADFTERFISTHLPGPLSSGRNLGNPDLIAEEGWHAEIGSDLQLIKDLQFSISGFFRSGQHVIDYVLTAATAIPDNDNLDPLGTYLFAQNIALVRTQGIDANVDWSKQVGDWTWRARLGYLFTTIQTDEPVNAKYITNQARHLLTATAQLQHKRWNLGINGLYKVRDEDAAPDIDAFITDDYTVWHMRTEAFIWQQKLSLFGQLHNIFNAQYADILGAQMPGRWWSIGARVRLGQD